MWTHDKPTKPGAYWYRNHPTGTPYLRLVDDDSCVYLFGCPEYDYLKRPNFANDVRWERMRAGYDIDGEWYGPLEPPR